MIGRRKKDPRTAYLRQVKKYLSCPSWEKKRLMSGLENEIDEAFPNGAISLEAITVRFGNPLSLARELEMSLSAESLARYIERKRLLIGIGLFLCIITIAILLVCLLWFNRFNPNYIVTDTFYS